MWLSYLTLWLGYLGIAVPVCAIALALIWLVSHGIDVRVNVIVGFK